MEHIGQKLEDVRNCKDENLLLGFLKDNRPGVALEIAQSAHATESILERLTRHPLITVRHAVAKNVKTSSKTLLRLCDDKDMLVRDYARRTLLLKERS